MEGIWHTAENKRMEEEGGSRNDAKLVFQARFRAKENGGQRFFYPEQAGGNSNNGNRGRL